MTHREVKFHIRGQIVDFTALDPNRSWQSGRAKIIRVSPNTIVVGADDMRWIGNFGPIPAQILGYSRFCLAEDTLPDELGRLGWEMTRRRVELLKPHLIELTRTTVRTFPVGSAAAVTGVLALGWMLLRAGRAVTKH